MPAKAFPAHPLFFSVYIGLGLLLSSLLHVWVWQATTRTLATWYRRFGIVEGGIPLTFVVGGAVLVAVIGLVSSAFLFHRASTPEDFLFWGLAMVVVLPFLSQLFASSVTKFIYDLVFTFLGVGGFLLTELLLQRTALFKDQQVQVGPWKLLRTATRGSLALIALLAGTIASTIVSRYQGADIYSFEIVRHVLLMVYFGIGLLFLVFPPILLRIIRSELSEP